MRDRVSIMIDGQQIEVPAGVTVAAALMIGGRTAFRHSVQREPRAPICGMGICLECRVTIDNHANQRSCQLFVREGMTVRTT